MNPEAIAQYLRDHPEFLVEHSDVFVDVTVPHPHGGQAITLAERQLHTLRAKIRQLEAKFAELIRYGEENDEISTKLHRLTIELVSAEELASFQEALLRSLHEDFSVPHATLRVWNTVVTPDGEAGAPTSEEMRFEVADMRHPYCGKPVNEEVLEWFGETSSRLRSLALVPLRHQGQVLGLLALASEENERFYADMGTLYLERLGETIAAGVRRLLG